MDDKGFVFTGDAVLALIIFFIFSASILTYYTMPAYMGSDHEQLETLAADTLAVMQTDGSLISAAALSTTDPAKAEAELRDRLNSIIPPGTSYRLTVGGSFVVENNSGGLANKDTATRVVVISNPGQGWVGRAWYKVESVEFQNVTINSTTTAWNFHNYLTNFDPWRDSYGNARLSTYHYWGSASGSPNTPINIRFSLPPDATINGGIFLLGSNNQRDYGAGVYSYGSNVTVNSYRSNISYNNFTYIYSRDAGAYGDWPVWNYKGLVPSSYLLPGVNYLNVNFTSPVSNYVDAYRRGHTMPWFSMLASYSTNITIPEGIITETFNFTDTAGVGRPTQSVIFDLNTGTLTNTSGASMSWGAMFLQNHLYQDGHPFALTNIPNQDDGSAVCRVQDVYIPPEGKVLDAYTVLNAYGGVDNALIEVWNGERWSVVFCSFDFNTTNTSQEYSVRADGYGNTPGIVYINASYFRAGVTNKVRVTVWDQVPSSDYDLVGFVDSYTTVSYTSLPIRWENFPFQNWQNTSSDTLNYSKPIQNFIITEGAQKAYLFFGVGLDTRQVSVELKYPNNNTWKVLYNNTSIPFSLDIASLDAAKSNGTNGIIAQGNANNYTLKNGSYQLRLTVYSSPAWESGDKGGATSTYRYYANPEVYSGTRIAIIYPKFLSNLWNSSYSSDPTIAQNNARYDLSKFLNQTFGRPIDPSPIKTEAIFTGDLPTSIPVRLELWRN